MCSNDELGDDRLKGVMALDTVLGAHLGAAVPQTRFCFLLNRLAAEAAGREGRSRGP